LETNAQQQGKKALFTSLSSSMTGIDFRNTLTMDLHVNPQFYVNSFNGGGVGIGDVNNDGLDDIYLTGNMVSNRLYLNRGDMSFEDVTELAGVDGQGGWSTGVSMVDINQDGLLDIYVCRAFGKGGGEMRENLLYINQGDGSFSEEAEAYGVNDSAYSTQGVFFDYDLDGDLDLYVGNNPREFRLSIEYSLAKTRNPQLNESDRLYRNNGDHTFTDVTEAAGILNYGFLLGVVVGDMNKDGLPDIYVSNDHQEPDKYYQNNGDGTFSNVIDRVMKHTSNFSMGLDLADFNNDGWLDLVVLDMLAEDNYRQKTQMKGMDPEVFWIRANIGYHYQYMRNTLQLNNGNGSYSEIGLMAGIANTDWSWAVLMEDFDNDGFKDLFVTNGYRKDVRDNDYIIAFFDLINKKKKANLPPLTLEELQELTLNETKLINYFFLNNGDLTFSDRSAESGFTKPTFSNGAAYSDLDNDGDLDLVINNLMDLASIYQNNTSEILSNNYISLQLIGQGSNLGAFGAVVEIQYGDQFQYKELSLVRGFQSSVSPFLHFGLGSASNISSLTVRWPDGRKSILKDIAVNQRLILNQKDSNSPIESTPDEVNKLFVEYSQQANIDFTHEENEYDDYLKEVLLPHKMSQFGPNITTGDVNGDGLVDFFIGGASWQSGALYLQDASGEFRKSAKQPWERHRMSEDIGVLLFDAEGDGDLDLYVVSGGNEFSIGSPLLQDRLYLNSGKGSFVYDEYALPHSKNSGSCVVAGDYDQDGDLDLFIGGRVVPGLYPFPAQSSLLRNEGGRFTDVTEEFAPDLREPGLVTSAIWSDYNTDGWLDLLLVGEWMPITVFENQAGKKLKNRTSKFGLENTTGWWNKIIASDIDRDGDPDYLLGNLGLNYKYKATEAEPLHIYCHDFDNSGTRDIVLGYYNDGTCYPVRGRQCSSEQIPGIKNMFPTYESFGNASLEQVYGEGLKEALHYEAKYFSSSYMENKGRGEFVLSQLPIEAQFSTIFGIIPHDYDQDGHLDLLIAGNFYVSEVETGRADASIGLLLSGDGKGNFSAVPGRESGFNAHLDVRDIALIKTTQGNLVLVANNDDRMQVFKILEPESLFGSR